MPNQRRYVREIKKRAVKLVLEHEREYPSQWKAICSIAKKSDLSHETLRLWVRQPERDEARRPWLTTSSERLMDPIYSAIHPRSRMRGTSAALLVAWASQS